VHHRGVVTGQPGLYFVGLSFLYAMSSGFLPGVDRDAEHIVHAILAGAGRTADKGARRAMRSG
jgi:putative flavoprotein involved in K+ transport